MSGEPPRSSLVLYQTEDGRTRVQCRFDGDTLWLTQVQLAELFQTSVPNINLHLKAIFAERELLPEATIKSYLMVRPEGRRQVSRQVLHYSLPVVLAVGYRVRSARGTQFRQWATEKLAEFVVKGFTLDDERLKNPPGPDVPDYFDELLERIRDIRASERRMYTRVRDIMALAADYQTQAPETQHVFQVVQNKLHHAVTGMTAPEIIATRADATKPNMGLTTWSAGSVQKSDVVVAKNYLHELEITELNRIVVMFLDFAEDQAQRKRQVFLRDWPQKLDEFLRFNERNVLPDAGRVSREAAHAKAKEQYDAFAERRRALAEVQGQADAFKALEDAAKVLPKGRAKARKGGVA
jgi:hypothetical protein